MEVAERDVLVLQARSTGVGEQRQDVLFAVPVMRQVERIELPSTRGEMTWFDAPRSTYSC